MNPYEDDSYVMYKEVCLRCKNHIFCENYGDETCEASDVLDFLLKKGKITVRDIREYREDLVRSLENGQ